MWPEDAPAEGDAGDEPAEGDAGAEQTQVVSDDEPAEGDAGAEPAGGDEATGGKTKKTKAKGKAKAKAKAKGKAKGKATAAAAAPVAASPRKLQDGSDCLDKGKSVWLTKQRNRGKLAKEPRDLDHTHIFFEMIYTYDIYIYIYI